MADTAPELPDAEALFDEFPCGLMVTSVRGVVLKVNRTFCDAIGVTAADLRGTRIQDLFTMGGRIFYQTHWMPMLAMQGSAAEVKFEIRHRDGHLLPMLINAVRRQRPGGIYDELSLTVTEDRHRYERELLVARGRALELVQSERDVQRALLASQSQLRQAIRVGALHMWDVDTDTGLRRYDDTVALLLGAPGAGRVDEQAYLDAIVSSDQMAEAIAFDAALKDATRVHSWTCRLEGADGRTRVVLASGQAFHDETGKLSQFVGVLSDITAETSRRELAEDRALFAEQMVGIVSHDLRNPLSAIQMGASMLARGTTLTPKQRDLLDRVSTSTLRARRLIDELLDFTLARVGRGLTVSRRLLDLHAVVAHSLDELRMSFPSRTLRHVAQGDGACMGDADRIEQLVGNLVANAVSYGSADADITVRTQIDGPLVAVSVHNLGRAIPPSLIGSIFEPMVRGGDIDRSTRSVGLGLFIVQAIAEAHAGRVVVTSYDDEGTTFEFRFPRDVPPVAV